ncbi:hypothetical protein POTOM_044369 [Populus tomentosa]|uniref:F-box domain-containing protein n=1 Tax=Populus tomentosa TaxID=118781 RepID=A0A8X8CF63_POPTO|nr:hypothetical protein POTOM_044369 [Populus tomentosa]
MDFPNIVRAQNQVRVQKRMASHLTNNHVIIADILSRLPVKTLSRFNCVCKLWYCMINSDPGFQALHHSRSWRNPRLLFRLSDFDFNPLEHLGHRYAYNFVSTDTEGKNIRLMQIKVHEPVKLILPGCFGLLVFSTDTRIHVCNPSTRRILALPDYKSKIAGFGVGYLSSIRRLKIVRLIPRRPSSLHLECSVFTLAPGEEGFSWRVLNDQCPYLVDHFSLPAFANETIYWKIDHWIPTSNLDWRSPIRNSTQLVELRGTLCMIQTLASSHVAVWKLADHKNSMWVKICMIDTSRIHPNFVGEVQCIKDGEIIFNSASNHLLYYDVRKKTFRKKMLPHSAENLTSYCESLTSLTR